MSKHVVISGYYGFENLGDEAVLQAIVRALREVEPDLRITVLSADPALTTARYGVEAKARWKFAQIVPVLSTADLLISGGGSLLQDVTSQMTIPYYLGVVGMALFLGKKVAFYAQGIGPINGSLGQRLTRLIANKVSLITVRDQESYDLLKRLGVAKPRLELTVDPVVLLKSVAPTSREFNEIVQMRAKCRSTGRPIVGIAPRPWGEQAMYQRALIETARNLQERLQAEVVLIPMHRQQDTQFCQEMLNQLPGAVMLKEQYTPSELLAIVERMDLVIGVRLHALILASVAGVPNIGITYDPKIDAFLARMEDEAVSDVENLNAEELYTEAQYRLENWDSYAQKLKDKMAVLQEKAWANARMILDLIN